MSGFTEVKIRDVLEDYPDETDWWKVCHIIYLSGDADISRSAWQAIRDVRAKRRSAPEAASDLYAEAHDRHQEKRAEAGMEVPE